MTSLSAQVKRLSELMAGHPRRRKADAQALLDAADLTRSWIHHFRLRHDGKVAADLLTAAESAIVEAAALVSLRLGRAAISALRTEIDVLLAYTYFCDHPREWAHVGETGRGFMLRDDVTKYHAEVNPEFAKRFEFVKAANPKSLEQTYRTLSAHIHAQSTQTVPVCKNFVDLVSEEDFVASVIELQGRLSNALSDFLLAAHVGDWSDAPSEAVSRVENLLSKPQSEKFFT